MMDIKVWKFKDTIHLLFSFYYGEVVLTSEKFFQPSLKENKLTWGVITNALNLLQVKKYIFLKWLEFWKCKNISSTILIKHKLKIW